MCQKYQKIPAPLPAIAAPLESAVNCQPSHRGEALSAEAQLSYASKNSLKTIKNIYKKSDFFKKKNSIFTNFQTPKTYLKFI